MTTGQRRVSDTTYWNGKAKEFKMHELGLAT